MWDNIKIDVIKELRNYLRNSFISEVLLDQSNY